MSRLGKRYFAKMNYLNFKDEYITKYRSLDIRVMNFNIKDYNKLVILLGMWKGLHKLFLKERKYGHGYRNKHRHKLRTYHRNYKRRKWGWHGLYTNTFDLLGVKCLFWI